MRARVRGHSARCGQCVVLVQALSEVPGSGVGGMNSQTLSYYADDIEDLRSRLENDARELPDGTTAYVLELVLIRLGTCVDLLRSEANALDKYPEDEE